MNTTSEGVFRVRRVSAFGALAATLVIAAAFTATHTEARQVTQPRLCISVPVGTASVLLGSASGEPSTARATDPVGPFPLSAILPFPWASIDGIWTMKLPDGTPLYFSFEAQSDCNGKKILSAVTFDRATYRLTGKGVGLALSNDTMVRAAMTTPSAQYMLFIRQFKQAVQKPVSRQVTVVTIRPFNGDEKDDVHMIARKVSMLTLDQYVARQHELKLSRDRR